MFNTDNTNLLEETLSALEKNGVTSSDVLWCGNKEGYCSWEEFVKAANFTYDSGYGGTEVADDLVIVGENWWLERAEYDGSEWWSFKTCPTKPVEERTLFSLKNK